MSTRSNLPAMVSSSSRAPKTTTYPSYNLEQYLRKPPTSAVERVVSNQKPTTPTDRETKVKAELESWSAGFDRAGKSKHKDEKGS
ncbi:uncharacterized protein GGS22DRAFT_200269 [Annulohypoxylon maeteangense]|uniref:uncharacterized protein n=1 Tax=Annulohypoxylon maeteangense TaxID=1927788 RepID=UPI0020084D53|nr:uncharacterized protein GGS22DRAFT_200269 [Annulohypoxylon maeteangense]KAI0885365.1 hypothetical protein GGS22DRAFT_200269 [Annulohypoxylon maeteangense]